MDSFGDLIEFVRLFREKSDDDIVIYTGYYKEEIEDYINQLKQYKNIIVKFGRYIPDEEKHRDSVLEVNLASNNQYAEKIS
jgi:DNA gyrase/topoisomerase IV subunit B